MDTFTDNKMLIEAAMADLKGALELEDPERIQEKSNALAEAAQKLGEEIYKTAGGDGAPSGGDGPQSDSEPGDDVVDADFEEVKDDDKDDDKT